MSSPALEIEDSSQTVSFIVALADYAATCKIDSSSALETARHCLIDALGGGFEALRDPECAALIGPLVPGAVMPGGARVPGTSLELDPAQAAFCTTLFVCRSRSRGDWLTLRGGRAGDSLGAILAVADYQGRKAIMEGKPPPKVRDALAAIVRSLEIQGVLACDDARQSVASGAATMRLARVAATTAVVAAQLGGAVGQIASAISHACLDGGSWVDEYEASEIGHVEWTTANAISGAVRHACQATATTGTSRASGPTSPALAAAHLAGKLLGAEPAVPRKPPPRKRFGTGIVDRLTAARTPEDVAQLTARFRTAVDQYFPIRQAERIKLLFAVPERLEELPVNELLAALVTNGARQPQAPA